MLKMYSLLVAMLAGVGFAQFPPAPSAPPKRDAFYNQPSLASIQSLTPGTILDYREQPYIPPAFSPGASPSKAWSVKYVTKDASLKPVAAVTTIVVPQNAATVNGQSVLFSYQAAYDSANLDCSPSYQLGNHQNNINNFTESLNFEMGVMTIPLNKGWYVIVPDYEGLTAAFTSGLTSGRAVLDGITAAINSGKSVTGRSAFTSISSVPRTALVGYSGGAIATEWAAELQSTYAPSLDANIVGIVAGGLPVNVTNTLFKVNGPSGSDNGSTTYLIPNALQGIGTQFPAFANYLQSSLDPNQVRAFNFSQDSCNDANYYSKQDIFFTYFKSGVTIDSFVANSVYQSTVNQTGVMGLHGRPTHPIYIFQGGKDEIVSANATTDLVKKYCGADFSRKDISLEYTLIQDQDHAGEAINGIGGALQFVQDRVGGVPAITGCTSRSTEPPTTFTYDGPKPTAL